MKVKLKDLPKVTSIVDGKGKRDRSGKKLQEVLDLYRSGMSYIDIASQLGLSYANVHYYVRKNKGAVDSNPQTV
jgi:DNA-binding NarL/FixJ family response regulator